MDTLEGLPLRRQDQLLLLRGSLQQRIAHLPRVCTCDSIGLAVTLEARAVDSACFIMGSNNVGEVARRQMLLPTGHGGLGLRNMSTVEGRAAYMAAAAMAQSVMATGPAEFRPFESLSGAQRRPAWQALHAEYGDLWDAALSEVTDQDLPAIMDAQRAVGRHKAQRAYADVLAAAGTASDAGRATCARLHSRACGLALAWLSALPTTWALTLRDKEVQASLRHRFAVAQMPPNAPGVQCKCRLTLRPGDTDHAMRCLALVSQTTMRHDILQGILRRVARQAGIASSAEPTLCRLPGLTGGAAIGVVGQQERRGARGNVLLAMDSATAVADISVIHPSGAATLGAAALTDGAAARRDTTKRAAYNALEPNGYDFIPFPVESYGRLGKPALALLSRFGEEVCSSGPIWKGAFLAGALRELSVGLCRGNATMYCVCLGQLVRT
jgi:hypothetical protein